MSVHALDSLAGASTFHQTGFASAVRRYGLSAFGPICISAAHFIVALLLLHAFNRSEFGLFSFVLVIVPFCLSLVGALIGAPVAISARRGKLAPPVLSTYLKANLAFGGGAALGVFLLVKSNGAKPGLAFLLAAYGGVMTIRWFARTLCYATGSPPRVAVSDSCYSIVLVTGFLLLFVFRALSATSAAVMLLGAASAGLLGLGLSNLRQLLFPSNTGSLAGYGEIWRDLARWSTLGVVLSEFTNNAHAYLVTFIAGPAAFAPLAIGALLMRPVQLVLAAVPDLERPLLARRVASGDRAGMKSSVNQFRMAAGAIWLATATLSAGFLMFYPQLVLKKTYDPFQAAIALFFFAAIALARTVRTPDAVLLQAAGQFRPLAGVSVGACAVSLASTLLLLLVFGPIWSLAGILAGELVVLRGVRVLLRNWLHDHG